MPRHPWIWIPCLAGLIACATPPDPPPTAPQPEGLWAGVNSADIFDEPPARRHAMLDTLARQNLRVIRVWIDYRFEPEHVGTFDPALLDRVNVLLDECRARDLKVMIVFHSSYWMIHGSSKETYLSRWTVEEFYRSPEARDAYRQRVQAIMEHRDSHGVPWTDVDTIWAWELQNEPLIFGDALSRKEKTDLVGDWLREMATFVRSLDPDGTHIALGTAGYGPYYYPEEGVGDSLAAIGNVPDASIYTLHYYGPGGGRALDGWIDDARRVTDPLGKLLLVEEFNPKRKRADQAIQLRRIMETCRSKRVPWMLWEYGPAYDNDDLYHDESVWTEVVATEAAKMWEERWTPPGDLRWGVQSAGE